MPDTRSTAVFIQKKQKSILAENCIICTKWPKNLIVSIIYYRSNDSQDVLRSINFRVHSSTHSNITQSINWSSTIFSMPHYILINNNPILWRIWRILFNALTVLDKLCTTKRFRSVVTLHFYRKTNFNSSMNCLFMKPCDFRRISLPFIFFIWSHNNIPTFVVRTYLYYLNFCKSDVCTHRKIGD